MADKFELARKVFGLFQAEYERNAHRTGVYLWSLDLRGDDSSRAEQIGLTPADSGVGLGILARKGLLAARTATAYVLTPEGKEVCLYPQAFANYLAQPRPKAAPPTVNISGGNNQIGNGNTQNITYQALLRETARLLETQPTLPESRRAAIAVAFVEASDLPDIEALVRQAAQRAGAK